MGNNREAVITQLGPLTIEMADKALAPFVGMPLTGFYKPIWAIFEFGEQLPDKNRKGEDVTFSDWCIDLHGVWQVTNEDKVVLGSADMPWRRKGRGRRFFSRMTPPPDPDKRIRWQAANDFFDRVDAGNLIVASVSGGPAGAICIELSDGFAIRTFTGHSATGDLWTVRKRTTDYSFWANVQPTGPSAYTIQRF